MCSVPFPKWKVSKYRKKGQVDNNDNKTHAKKQREEWGEYNRIQAESKTRKVEDRERKRQNQKEKVEHKQRKSEEQGRRQQERK